MPLFSRTRNKDLGAGRRTNAAGQTLSGGTFATRNRTASAVTLELPPQPVRHLATPIVRPARHRAPETDSYGLVAGQAIAPEDLFCGHCKTTFHTPYQASRHICRR